MSWDDEIWDAAEIICEWDGPADDDDAETYRYKLYTVPRAVIDEDSTEPDALLLHGLDDGNVRRVDLLLDHPVLHRTAPQEWDQAARIIAGGPVAARQAWQAISGGPWWAAEP